MAASFHSSIDCKMVLTGYDALTPPPRAGAALLSLPDGPSLMLIGGANGEGVHFNDVWIYSITSKEWKEVSTYGDDESRLPPVSGHAAVLVGAKVFVVGGMNFPASMIYNGVHILDTVTSTWSKAVVSGTPPSPRNAHSLAYDKVLEKVVLFGGSSPSEGLLNDVYLFDVKELRWEVVETVGLAPCPRELHGSCLVDLPGLAGKVSSLCVTGGRGEAHALSDMSFLNLSSMAWSRGGGLATARMGHAVSPLPAMNSLLLFGGIAHDMKLSSDSLLYDFVSEAWITVSLLPDQPEPRFSHSMASCSNVVYVFGGVSFEETFGDLHAFTPSILGLADPDRSRTIYMEEI